MKNLTWNELACELSSASTGQNQDLIELEPSEIDDVSGGIREGGCIIRGKLWPPRRVPWDERPFPLPWPKLPIARPPVMPKT